ncbi:MAG: hypothetical protein AB1584_22100 [Pseudomonadota bacterium]
MILLRNAIVLAAALGCTCAHAARELAPQSTPAPLSTDEESLTRLIARKDLIGAIVSHCAQAFPASQKKMQDAFAAWQQPRQSALEQAAMVMLTRSSREDADAAGALVRDEQQKLQTWVARDLGIPQERKPTLEDCNRIAQGLASLPDAAGPAGARP